jgi:hypothetical protein
MIRPIVYYIDNDGLEELNIYLELVLPQSSDVDEPLARDLVKGLKALLGRSSSAIVEAA